MSNTLNDVRFQLKQKVQRVARRVDESWQFDLRNTGPVDTGDLRDSTTVEHKQSRNRVIWTAEVGVPYAEAVAEGTRPHVIRAVNKNALRFYWGKAGKVVYFKQVTHPGTQPNRWFDTLLNEQPRRLQQIWDRL